MNRWIAISSLACFFLSNSTAQVGTGTPAKTKADANVEKLLMQMERDWLAAETHKDRTVVDRILGDDWSGVDPDGKTEVKAQFLNDMVSPDSRTDSATITEMKVRIFGGVAVVTGSEVEKSQFKGKDTSGRYTWTDVFAQRNGRWQAVASHVSRVLENGK
jgi:ketosteroid isomerase-like protein